MQRCHLRDAIRDTDGVEQFTIPFDERHIMKSEAEIGVNEYKMKVYSLAPKTRSVIFITSMLAYGVPGNLSPNIFTSTKHKPDITETHPNQKTPIMHK